MMKRYFCIVAFPTFVGNIAVSMQVSLGNAVYGLGSGGGAAEGAEDLEFSAVLKVRKLEFYQTKNKKTKKPKSTLLADNTQGLITTKHTKPRSVASVAREKIRIFMKPKTRIYSLLLNKKYSHTKNNLFKKTNLSKHRRCHWQHQRNEPIKQTLSSADIVLVGLQFGQKYTEKNIDSFREFIEECSLFWNEVYRYFISNRAYNVSYQNITVKKWYDSPPYPTPREVMVWATTVGVATERSAMYTVSAVKNTGVFISRAESPKMADPGFVIPLG